VTGPAGVSAAGVALAGVSAAGVALAGVSAAGVSVAGVALAAGRGERLRPLTDLRPKVLFPVDGVSLLDRALSRLAGHGLTGPGRVSVNAHYRSGQIRAAVGGRARVSVERPQALGTAGALGQLHEWLAGRDVLVVNADVDFLDPDALAPLLAGRSAARAGGPARCRLLCAPAGDRRTDFVRGDDRWRYLGACLLPWAAVRRLRPEPSGLYEVLWRELEARGELDVVAARSPAVDCGTAADYLAANLARTGGRSVIGAGAVVEGVVERCVVWPGARVGPGEHLRDSIRAGTPDRPVTVPAN
jgi:N-acetyl-alpha-D-muramate 1-phosphate uridylyltransferase